MYLMWAELWSGHIIYSVKFLNFASSDLTLLMFIWSVRHSLQSKQRKYLLIRLCVCVDHFCELDNQEYNNPIQCNISMHHCECIAFRSAVLAKCHCTGFLVCPHVLVCTAVTFLVYGFWLLQGSYRFWKSLESP